MTDAVIDYDMKVQQALKGVVRSVLSDVARDGLQGDHHFYITFKTQAPSVRVPSHLSERFPDEMTIVLQNKFWGLEVSDDRFEVGLSFNQQPETLSIPFDAVIGFVDPSVQFALQFQEDGLSGDTGMDEASQDALLLADPEETQTITSDTEEDSGNVVTLDAFRKDQG